MEQLLSALATPGEIPSHVLNSLSGFEWQQVGRFLAYCAQTSSYQHPWFEPSVGDDGSSSSSSSARQDDMPEPEKNETVAPSSPDKDKDKDRALNCNKQKKRRRRERRIVISRIKELISEIDSLRKGYDDYDDDEMKRNTSFSDVRALLHSRGKDVIGDESTDYSATPDDNRENGIKHESVDSKTSYRSHVKEDCASKTSMVKQQLIHKPRPRVMFPEIKKEEAIIHHDPDLPRSKVPSRRGKSSSVSSDSGMGEATQGSGNASTSTTCSVHMSNSDRSDCDSNAHNPDPSKGAHTHDLDSGDETTNEVFSHDLEEEQAQLNKEDSCTLPGKLRLNFHSRRRMVFGEESESRRDVSASSQDSSPSSPASSCSASSFVKSFRPLYSRQDSDSTSSVLSDDSLLATPLSPVPIATAADHRATLCSPFPEMCSQKLGFSEPSKDCDLVLVAEGKRFYVHTAVVAWQCTALLQHLQQTGSEEVVLQDKRAADVLCMLHLLYPNYGERITEDNVSALVDLAYYLSCERVLRLCTAYLISLASFHHLCPHRHLPPCPPPQTRAGEYVKKASRTRRACSCASTVVDRVLDVLTLATRYELEDVYRAYKDFAASSIKASVFLSSSRFKHMSAAIRQDILMSRLTRLENVQDKLLVSLQESDLVSCRHHHHHRHRAFRLTFSGPLCLKCSAKRFLQKAHSLG